MPTLAARFLLAVTVVLVLVGCGGADPKPEPPTDDAGPPVSCQAGTQGCPCMSGRCAKAANGESLLCLGGTCEAMSCPAGDNGCVCRGGTECNAPGATCTNGFCVAPGCTPGTADCACIAGTCDVGLTCVSGTVCVDNKGYEGGACLPNGSCYRGSRCDAASRTCVYCSPGTPGCQCTQAGGCNEGLVCAVGACVAANPLPPSNPACFTPCREDLNVGGTQLQCGSDGLVPGCFDGLVCTQGSCLLPGEAKPTCASDVECPFFQVCISGGCYSNCDATSDCGPGRGCYKRACRLTCGDASGQAACPTGSACVADDGRNGYCLPTGAASAPSAPTPTGGLKALTGTLELSNVKPSGSFAVTSSSPITQDVTVRKKWHRLTTSAGPQPRVDAQTDSAGKYLACSGANCPLWWLTLGVSGAASSGGADAGAAGLVPTLDFRLPPACVDEVALGGVDGGARPCPRVQVGAAGNVQATSWEGELELSSGQGGTTTVHLSYVQRPDGQWVGSMFYFGTFNTRGLGAWIDGAGKDQVSSYLAVENALIQKWGGLRTGNLGGWQEFTAVLTATRAGSWNFGEVKNKCRALANGNAATSCYPYIDAPNPQGLVFYVQNNTGDSIPSGVTELPVGFNLKVDPSSPARFSGRVESSLAMHYPGNPEITFEFATDPSTMPPSSGTGAAADRIMYLKGIESVGQDINRLVSTVGGRLVAPDGQCPSADFAAVDVPWLVPGFTLGTREINGRRVRTECRDSVLPFDGARDPTFAGVNRALAGGNPVPDGNPRRRTLRFIDGALVNQSQLFLLFEESFESFIPGQAPTTAYGYMLLRRAPAELEASDYVGRPTSTATRQVVGQGVTCSPDLVSSLVPDAGATLTPTQMGVLVDKLINGSQASGGGYTAISNPANGTIQYYCEANGFFNGGPNDNGSAQAQKVPCPAGSKVIYFNAPLTDAQVAAQDCQRTLVNGRGTCFERLKGWMDTRTVVVEYEPYYRCTNTLLGGKDNYCDENRSDLRDGKTFYVKPASAPPPMLGLNALIDRAFRYKTQFRSSSGGSLGFAPTQCVPNSASVPYCYDPAETEQARSRIDCLVDLYSRPGVVKGPSGGAGTLDQVNRTQLLAFLQSNFSAFPPVRGTDGGIVEGEHEAFERLYAELLIMQGDEALTAAYASRFDLAATASATFRGSDFELGGIDLTGVAGAEMTQLYRATQYYQLALDRLYQLGPNMKVALSLDPVGSSNDFITPETVTAYMERLVRAAAQKARAWGEVARRYQNFNKPELARAVVERAYVASYLESALLSRTMQDIGASVGESYRDQVRLTIDKAQRTTRMSLLDMRDVYAKLSDELNYFGYPAEYIPFPALDSAAAGSANAFDSLLTLAKQRLDLARQREQVALSSGRQGRVDAAQFQSDLVGIRNNYENQLAQACGTFRGEDGRVYPAIKKYAQQNSIALQLGDPCGRMGNGDIHQGALNAQDGALKIKGVLLRQQNILQDIETERKRVAAVCGVMQSQVDYQFNVAQTTSSLQEEMAEQRAETAIIVGSINAVIAGLQATNCEAVGCVKAAITGVAVAGAGLAAAGTQYANDLKIAEKETALRDFEANSVRLASNFACNVAAVNDGGFGGYDPDGGTGLGLVQIESNARIASMINDTFEVQVEALRADYALRGAAAEVERMYSNAQRIQAQYEEAEQLAIDVQQAQNDPNVRIYQNDAIINADLSFNDAMATAYRLTRVYEYYTSQSYARKEQLFLIRMVSAGFYNLENYLLQLENEYLAFEEQFGNPDVRVMSLSLRDDLMAIPYFDLNQRPLTESARITQFQERLKDPRLLDSRGYLTLPFSTRLDELSPVTRNHKVHHVEVDLQGVRMGDPMARVYLRSSGTGVVRNVSDALDYYVFPERLGVINATVNGGRPYDQDVYRNYRFRDRPLVNTLWELVFNQRDEAVNKDIDLATLSDVRILVYYTDFTSF